MEVIVTGGAGYIGAHIVDELIGSGHKVVIIDDLSTGKLEFVNPLGIFIKGQVQDQNTLEKAFKEISDVNESGVIHAAGLKFAGESVKNPIAFYEANCVAVLSLLKSMKKFGLNNLIFSSSSSVYGNLMNSKSASENSVLKPLSPYGRSKLYAESIIEDCKNEIELRAVSLRYFNVIGNGDIPAIDQSNHNLLPNLYRAMASNSVFQVFGANYSTPDGSCIRDYVDVKNLARAHSLALTSLIQGVSLPPAINLGSGVGHSIFEIIETASSLIDRKLNIQVVAGRTGDPARIIAECGLARKYLSWKADTEIGNSVLDGWNAWQRAM